MTEKWVLRDEVYQFVINGYTHQPVAVVHTPECAHVREAFPPFVEEPVLEVINRFPRTGVMTHNGVRKVDLLAVLFEHTYGPAEARPKGYRVEFCQHCAVRRVKQVSAA